MNNSTIELATELLRRQAILNAIGWRFRPHSGYWVASHVEDETHNFTDPKLEGLLRNVEDYERERRDAAIDHRYVHVGCERLTCNGQNYVAQLNPLPDRFVSGKRILVNASDEEASRLPARFGRGK